MKRIGIIMEINPFHNGHKYFLEQIPKNSDDLIIAIISSHICQRGEISTLNKFAKASLLLDNNVDLVIELPFVHSNQGGYHFAYNALNHLKELEITDLYFGSESNDLENLLNIAKNYSDEFDFSNGIYNTTLNTLNSNDILGMSYIRASKNLNMDINFNLIKRINNNYNDDTFNDSKIQSATSIRSNFTNGTIQDYLPKDAYQQVILPNNDILFEIFLNNLNIAITNNIKIFLSEENELLKNIYKSINKNNVSSINEIIELCSNKNNSKYKIQRLIINTTLLIECNYYNVVDYIRVLGSNNNGNKYIKELNNTKIINSLKDTDSIIKEKELLASNLYNLTTKQNTNWDYQTPVIKNKF